jgi:hypothetical protein
LNGDFVADELAIYGRELSAEEIRRLYEEGIAEVPVRPSPVPIPTDALVSWWHADGDAQDSVGANHGTLEQGVSYGSGVQGQAFSLDGVDSAVQVATVPILPPQAEEFTISAWVNGTAMEAAGGIFGQFNNDPETTGSDTNHFVTVDPVGRARFDEYPPSHDINGIEIFSTSVVADDRWHHLAVVVAGGTRYLYVDVILEATGPQEVYEGAVPNAVRIGDRNGYGRPDSNYGGRIDEVMLYSRALCYRELQAIYEAQRPQ